jgi:hypothetical protein
MHSEKTRSTHPSTGSSAKLDERVVTALKYCLVAVIFATVTA